MPQRRFLKKYAWLSIGAAVITITLKAAAYALTGSVGLLSDAIESIVNLVGATVALAMLTVAAQPPDDEHHWGHDKAEYFSSGAEGALIVAAAISIAVASIIRLIHPQPLEQAGLGLLVSSVATVVNLVVARVLFRVGKRFDSITLEADARHLMADVWTSAGVVGGVGLVVLTGWTRLDPIVGLLVAANVTRTGARLVQRSIQGLLDKALDVPEGEAIERILARYREQGLEFHAVRSRQAAARRFVTMHVLVPGDWTVLRGHELLERIEHEILGCVPNCTVLTHLEPIEDPRSFDDIELDRRAGT
jgi:cation diffusion facilitator family transporter